MLFAAGRSCVQLSHTYVQDTNKQNIQKVKKVIYKR